MFREKITLALSFLGKVDVLKDDENGWAWYMGRTLLVREGSKTHQNIINVIGSVDHSTDYMELDEAGYGNLYTSHIISNIILADLCKRYDTLATSVDNMDSEIEKAIGNVYNLLWHDCAD